MSALLQTRARITPAWGVMGGGGGGWGVGIDGAVRSGTHARTDTREHASRFEKFKVWKNTAQACAVKSA